MATHVLQTLGQRIIAARQAYKPRRMSQRELAKRISISPKSLNLIESGETADPKSSIVRNISDVLGVSTDWLLKGHPSASNQTAADRSKNDASGDTLEDKDSSAPANPLGDVSHQAGRMGAAFAVPR